MNERDRVKRVINEYFEERYRGFTGSKGVAFEKYCMGSYMEKEEKRYALQLEEAQCKGLTYTDWQYKLFFRKIFIMEKWAWVVVEEEHRAVFKITGYSPSYMKGLFHHIKLMKVRNRWYIVEHYCRDEYSVYRVLSQGRKSNGRPYNNESHGLISNTRLTAYNREAAVAYAHRWALDRNPRYYDFEELGGDCTNFCSQVIHAGGAPMRVDRVKGWYYFSLNDRSPSWSGVEFLYSFLMTNDGRGPHGEEVPPSGVQVGDIIQLDFPHNDAFNHSLVVVSNPEPGNINRILIATHTIDRDNYPLVYYKWRNIRFIHIKGYLM